jgi:hypothetical protein
MRYGGKCTLEIRIPDADVWWNRAMKKMNDE